MNEMILLQMTIYIIFQAFPAIFSGNFLYTLIASSTLLIVNVLTILAKR